MRSIVMGLVAASYCLASSWTPMKTEGQPLARHECAFIEAGGKLYLIGGRGEKPVNVYDPKTNRWSEAAAPPMEIHHFQPVVFDRKIYVLGALTGKYPHETPVPNVLIFDPKANRWSKGPAIPEDRRRGAAGVAVHDGKIYVLDGIQDGHWDGHVAWFDAFDPKTGAWTKLPDAPRPRDHFQSVVIGDKLYAAGGRLSSAKTGDTFKLSVGEVDIFDFSTGAWSTAKEKIPTERAGCFATDWKGRVLVLGGESGAHEAAHSEAEAFDPKTGKWTSLPGLAQGRHGTGVAEYGGKLWVAAGSANRGGGPELTTLEVWDGR
ncbi:MAG: kelch repeat-containing protein [Bryobacterales bacterium]